MTRMHRRVLENPAGVIVRIHVPAELGAGVANLRTPATQMQQAVTLLGPCVTMAGGELSQPAWVDEQYILDLEREAFLSLCGQEKTQERMFAILDTGRPLRN